MGLKRNGVSWVLIKKKTFLKGHSRPLLLYFRLFYFQMVEIIFYWTGTADL